MNPADDAALAAGWAAVQAGRHVEAYRLLRPLAEAGRPDAQAYIGSMMVYSLHRFENDEQSRSQTGLDLDAETVREDREQGGRFLEAASAAGIGPASFNLASLVVMGYGGGSWEERKVRAAELFALAHAQGFTAFGGLMHGEAPGQPYLDLLEKHPAERECPLPGEPDRGAEEGA